MSHRDTTVGDRTRNAGARRLAPCAIGLLQLCSAAALAQTNLAPAGIAYLWSHNATATADTNKAVAPRLNDGDTTVDVALNDGSGETATLYESGGVIWSSAQTIGEVQFINGTWQTSNDGAFCANLSLQTTVDGTTWTDSGWAVSPTYAYDSSAVSGVTYTFSGSPVSVLGVRVTGEAHCAGGNSDWDNMREVLAFASSVADATPPTAPGNLAARAASATQVNLSWTASSDNVGVTGYLVYRGSSQIAALGGLALSYQDTGLTPSTAYSYTVEAQDAAGNVSAPSNVATATTSAAGQPSAHGYPGPGGDGSTVGFTGDESTLTVIDGNHLPSSCTWGSTGVLEVRDANVTLDHVYIRGGVDVYGGGNFKLTNSVVEPGWGTDQAHVRCGRVNGATCDIENTTIRWKAGVPQIGRDSVVTALADVSLTIINDDLSGGAGGVIVGSTQPSIVSHNYIHDLWTSTDNYIHQDAIFADGGAGLVTISHNRLAASVCQTCSTASIFSQPGTEGALLSIQDNFIDGGGYSLYLESGTSAAIDTNVIGPDHVWGTCAFTGTVTASDFSGNDHGDASGDDLGIPFAQSECQ